MRCVNRVALVAKRYAEQQRSKTRFHECYMYGRPAVRVLQTTEAAIAKRDSLLLTEQIAICEEGSFKCEKVRLLDQASHGCSLDETASTRLTWAAR
jgi:hypothetical protein